MLISYAKIYVHTVTPDHLKIKVQPASETSGILNTPQAMDSVQQNCEAIK